MDKYSDGIFEKKCINNKWTTYPFVLELQMKIKAIKANVKKRVRDRLSFAYSLFRLIQPSILRYLQRSPHVQLFHRKR